MKIIKYTLTFLWVALYSLSASVLFTVRDTSGILAIPLIFVAGSTLGILFISIDYLASHWKEA